MFALCALVTGCSPADPSSMVRGGSGASDAPSRNVIGAAASGGGGSGIGPMSTADNPRQLTGGTIAAPLNGKGSGTGCTGLQCQQHMCPNGGSTTISGRVYDPAGKNPLYNVAVYVPNETPQALPLGASCAKCDSLYTGHPVVTSLTDADGKFTIKDAPDGDNIPLVVQIGKWRKQVKVSARRAVHRYARHRQAHAAAQSHRRRHPRDRDLDRRRRHARVLAAPHRRRRV